MNPNPVLMSIYGDDLLGAAVQPEQEKVAQAELLAEVLTTQGYDINKLASDEILAVAETLFGPDNDIAKIAMEGGEEEDGGESEEEDDEAEAKAKEAEFAGQIMAHAFAREIRSMPDEAFEKNAGIADMTLRGAASSLKSGAQSAGRSALKSLKRAATGSQFRTGSKQLAKGAKARKGAEAGKNLANNKNMSDAARNLAGQRGGMLGKKADKLEAAGRANRRAGAAKTLGLYGGGAAALGGGAALASRNKEAFFELAEKRAAEILLENGIDPYTFEEVSPAEKIAADIEAGAWEILEQFGFQPE